MSHWAKATRWVAFFVFVSAPLVLADSTKPLQFRALWIVRDSVTSRAEIDKALQFAQKAQFNHLFVQVRGRGDALYSSQIVPPNAMIRDKTFDPLAYAVQKGHEMGLKVHAWMNVYLIWSSTNPPDTRNHVVNQYPEWLDQSSIGKTNVWFLAPSHPGVTNHLLEVFREVLSNYDIDGLHLDYVRYADADYGYNFAARKEFQREYGVDPLTVLSSRNDGSENFSDTRAKTHWQQWSQFRRNAVTNLVRKCNAAILDINPECLLSVAVKPDPEEAKDRYFQEWDRWLAEGLVDYVVPMNYTERLREFARNIDLIYDSIPAKFWPGVIMGIAVYNQDALDARDKIKYTKITGFPGISIFSYDSRKDDPDYFLPIVEEMLR